MLEYRSSVIVATTPETHETAARRPEAGSYTPNQGRTATPLRT
jgi:hypothetical protein